MISSLRGTVFHLDPSFVHLEVSCVGYQVWISFQTHLKLKEIPKGEVVFLFTFHSITDRTQRLFGFLSPKDRDLFLLMKSLNGIGEMTALRVLSFLTADELYRVVQENDKKTLEKIPKVKGKTSEKILFEVKQNLSRLESFLAENKEEYAKGNGTSPHLAVSALIQLGYDEKSALVAVEQAEKSGLSETTEILKSILKRK